MKNVIDILVEHEHQSSRHAHLVIKCDYCSKKYHAICRIGLLCPKVCPYCKDKRR